MAGALLQPASDSAEALVETLEVVVQQKRIAMFCSGARTLAGLRGRAITANAPGEYYP